ncbi:MAG: MotA/TolQ/ExbB proton channel family protein [Candidatus Schekmanbacteria bacterium]|nr:MotA/TolQ/ExbB proton channel family protein [Candidatus Schekmanbacteria bacterium]
MSLFWQTSIVAKIVLLVLTGFSVCTWAIIIQKLLHFGRIKTQTARFFEVLNANLSLQETYKAAHESPLSPTARLFRVGYLELNRRMKSGGSLTRQRLSQIRRALDAAAAEEISRLEIWMIFLAITASASPFIGLFGTVWGIMTAFHSIGGARSASLTVVAPGIAEALINTAAGLFAAIPAVMSYNLFLSRTQQIGRNLGSFLGRLENLFEESYVLESAAHPPAPHDTEARHGR